MAEILKILQEINNLDLSKDYEAADRMDNFIAQHANSITASSKTVTAQAAYENVDWSNPDAWKQFVPEKSTERNDNDLNLDNLPKQAKKMVDLFISGKIPGELSRNEFEELARIFGFNVENTKKHFYVSHPKLVGHPVFNTGIVSLSDHAHGKSNTMHYASLRDFRNALKHVYPQLFK